MELRNPNKGHYPLVEALLRLCFKPAWSGQTLVDRIYFDPDYDPNHVWMAREGGQVLGFLVTTLHENKAWVKLLAVDPSARRRGLAADLLSRAEYRLSGEGACEFKVEGSPPFEFVPGVESGSDAEAFFRSQGYGSTEAQTWWVPPALPGPDFKIPALDKLGAANFGRHRSGAAWSWVEETLGYVPPRMIYQPGQGLILVQPGQGIGPLWLVDAGSGAESLIDSARALASLETCGEAKGLRFWEMAGSQPWPGLPMGKAAKVLHFSKTLA